MAYPDLPFSAKTELASQQMREHHHLWHAVRNPQFWNALSPADQQQLVHAGWKASRFYGDAGSGIDFLGMHREMIPHVDHLLGMAGNPNWPKVIGWSPIPWNAGDADWPVPAVWAGAPQGIIDAKSAASVGTNQQIASQLTNIGVLRQITLDALGLYIEGSIHAWMHNRWSEQPGPDLWSLDPTNDYLGAPFSSHVNKHFWKLHGWIDERIGDWERANDRQADLSGAWNGPSGHLHSMPMAAPALRSQLEVPQSFDVRSDIVDKVLGLRRD